MYYFHEIFGYLILIFVLSRPFIVLMHELGHGIPAVLFSKKMVSIYIGTYGDSSKCFKLSFGLLEIYIRYNFFLIKGGVCIPTDKSLSINKTIIYTLLGPLTPFLVSIIVCCFSFQFNLSMTVKFIVVTILFITFIDLFLNLIPSNKKFILFDGKECFNDGQSILQLIKLKKMPKNYVVAINFYNDKEYEKASYLLAELIESGMKTPLIYSLLITSYLQDNMYEKAKIPADEFVLLEGLSSDDYSNAALVYGRNGLYKEAHIFYDKSLELNPVNLYSLNNKGYTFNLEDNFIGSILLFDKVLAIKEDFFYSLNNRGLAKIKIGKIEEGLNDISDSLKIEEKNSYAYRNLGIYNLDQGNLEEANRLFLKAKELDSSTDQIDELILKTIIN